MSLSRIDRVRPIALNALKQKDFATLKELVDHEELLHDDVLDKNGNHLLELILMSDGCVNLTDPDSKLAISLLKRGAVCPLQKVAELNRNGCEKAHPLLKNLVSFADPNRVTAFDRALAYFEIGEVETAESIFQPTDIDSWHKIQRLAESKHNFQDKIIATFHRDSIYLRSWALSGSHDGKSKQKVCSTQITAAAQAQDRSALNKAIQIINFTQERKSEQKEAPRTLYQFLKQYSDTLPPAVRVEFLTVFSTAGSEEQRDIASSLLAKQQQKERLHSSYNMLYPLTDVVPHMGTAKKYFEDLSSTLHRDSPMKAYAFVRLAECCLALAKKAEATQQTGGEQKSESSESLKKQAKQAYVGLMSSNLYRSLDHFARAEIANNLREMECKDELSAQYLAELEVPHPCPLLLDDLFASNKDSLTEVCKRIGWVDANSKELINTLVKHLCNIISHSEDEDIGQLRVAVFKNIFHVHNNSAYRVLNQTHRQKFFDSILSKEPGTIPAKFHDYVCTMLVVEMTFPLENSFIFYMFDNLIKSNLPIWEIAFSFFCEQLQKNKYTYESEKQKETREKIIARLEKLAEVSPENAGRVNEVLLQHYMIQDFGKAVVVAANIPGQKEDELSAAICRELVFVRNKGMKEAEDKKLSTRLAELRNLSHEDTEKASEKVSQYQMLVNAALASSNIEVALEALEDVLIIKKRYVYFYYADGLGKLIDVLILSLYNEKNVEAFPWELLKFAKDSKERSRLLLNPREKTLVEIEIVAVLRKKFANNATFKAFAGESFKFEEKESKIIQSCSKSKSFTDNYFSVSAADSFSTEFERARKFLLDQIDSIIERGNKKQRDSVIYAFEHSTQKELLKKIAFHIIDKINIYQENTVENLNFLYRLLNVYFKNKDFSISGTPISLYQQMMSIMKKAALHEKVTKEELAEIIQNLTLATLLDGPAYSFLAQRTLNQVCQICCNKGLHYLAARAGYPPAIAELIKEWIGGGYGVGRAAFILCRALLELLKNPEQMRQHFDLLHGEISTILFLREEADAYLSHKANKWPTLPPMLSANKIVRQGVIQPLFAFMLMSNPCEDLEVGFSKIFKLSNYAQFRALFLSPEITKLFAPAAPAERKEEMALFVAKLNSDADKHEAKSEIKESRSEGLAEPAESVAQHAQDVSPLVQNPELPEYEDDRNEGLAQNAQDKYEDDRNKGLAQHAQNVPPFAENPELPEYRDEVAEYGDVIAEEGLQAFMGAHLYVRKEGEKRAELDNHKEGEPSAPIMILIGPKSVVAAMPANPKPVVSVAMPANPEPVVSVAMPANPEPVVSVAMPANPEPVVSVAMPANPEPAVSVVMPANPKPVVSIAMPTNPEPVVSVAMPANPEPVVSVAMPANPEPAVSIAMPTNPEPAVAVMPAKAGIQDDAAPLPILAVASIPPIRTASPPTSVAQPRRSSLTQFSILTTERKRVQTAPSQGEPDSLSSIPHFETVSIDVRTQSPEGARSILPVSVIKKPNVPCAYDAVLHALNSAVEIVSLVNTVDGISVSIKPPFGNADANMEIFIPSNLSTVDRMKVLTNLASLMTLRYSLENKQSEDQRARSSIRSLT